MKKIIIFLILFGFNTFIDSQSYFQKINSGEIVSSVSSSNRCAWGDYDNDGYQDLVVTGYNDNQQQNSYPVLQYHNNGNGSFTRITSGSIASIYARAFGCAWGDYDNDGLLDLFICCGWNENNILFHNEGNGNFTRITSGIIVNDGGWSETCAWADYDRDGHIDLFVGNQSNQNNFLYHGNGNGTFTKVTSGSVVNDGGWTRGCAWGDYNNDSWLDLFAVNYQGQSDFLYRNFNGTLVRTYTVPVDNDWGSGCSWADFNNDGYLDLYVTNNNANNRLYQNNGNGTFFLSSSAPSFENGYSFGNGWADYNNDGWIDLVVAKQQSNNALFRNFNGALAKMNNEIICFEGGASAFSIWSDYNNDGKMDIFITNTGSPIVNYLYKNIGNSGNYIIIKLIGGCTSNKAAIGARINVFAGNLTMTREVSGGSNMGTQDMLWQHFGLGNINIIDSLQVYWPIGDTLKVERLYNIAVNQTLVLNECFIGIISNKDPVKYELKQNYPNPFNPATQIEYSLMKPADVKLSIFDIEGKLLIILVKEHQSHGTYRVDFNASNFASGIYVYRLETNDYNATKKMILIR